MQVMLMRLMSKGEYVIVPKGTKFTGAGKLGLRLFCFNDYTFTLPNMQVYSKGCVKHCTS